MMELRLGLFELGVVDGCFQEGLRLKAPLSEEIL